MESALCVVSAWTRIQRWDRTLHELCGQLYALVVWTINSSDSPSDMSAAYMQVLRNEPTGYAADLWALGCLLYRMLFGETPFAAASEYRIFERITSRDLHVPDTTTPAAQDLLKQLLDSDPKNRIGELLESLTQCVSIMEASPQAVHAT